MASRLPRELLDIVMDYLDEADNDDQSSLDYLEDQCSSLEAASLVCRSFRVSSQSRLFATISLRPPLHQLEEVEVGCLPRAAIPTNPKQGFKSSIEAFSRVMAASPHLLGYVRRLDLHGSPFPLHPALPPDHSDWLNSQAHHLMAFLPNLAPKLRSFGMYMVDWDTLLPEVVETIKTTFESKLLTSLILEHTDNLPIPVLASCAHLQHLNLQVGIPGPDGHIIPPNTWNDSALTRPVSNHQKSQLISLKIVVPFSVVDWFSTKYCIFDISHLRHLVVVRGHHDVTKIFQICSGSLESFEMTIRRLSFPPKGLDTVRLTALRKVHFRIPLYAITPVPGEVRNSLSWVNDLLKGLSQMLALEEIILNCFVMYKLSIPLDLLLFSETDFILARGDNLPALRSVNILVDFLAPVDQTSYTLDAIETIKMRMPLLRGMGIMKVSRRA